MGPKSLGRLVYNSAIFFLFVIVPRGGSLDNQVGTTSKTVTGVSSSQSALTNNDIQDESSANDQNATVASPLANRVFVWTHNEEMYPTNGKRLDGHTFMQTDRKLAKTQCAMECLRHSKCKSFNFGRDMGICQLNTASHLEKPEDLASDLNFEYHTRAGYSIDEEALGPCAKETCSHHGRCLETRSVDETLVALCLCEEGWQGRTCNRRDLGAQWAEWMAWGSCSVTCHRGWRVRQRQCEETNTGAILSSFECYGADQEYGVCQLQQCPSWKPWSEWGECSTQTSCGRGIKTRARECSNGGTVGVDRYCLGLSNETSPCEGPACNGPIQLSGSDVAGEGIVEIYDTIHKQWVSLCADQMTQHIADLVCRQVGWPGAHAAITDGRFGSGTEKMGLTIVTCTGNEYTVTGCQHNAMSMEGGICKGDSTIPAAVQCNVNGVWSLWSLWSDCDVTCENGTRTRTRTCNHPPALHAGKPCAGDDIQFKACSLPMCPIDGEWKPWQEWSACSKTCGGGQERRMRECQQPQHGGDVCVGDGEEVKDCNTHNCPIDGVWSKWSDWGTCSVTCAWGIQWRNRTCDGPYFDGIPCQGNDTESQTCHPQSCPVDGHWLDWENWAACSTTCGGGVRQRQRTCYHGKFGGKDCDGTNTDMGPCNEHHCPVDGVWQSWSVWGDCSLTCGNGTKTRTRICKGPFYGGANCSGSETDELLCNTFPCPVDGFYDQWAAWSECSTTCGGGTQWRNRTCIPPKYGGEDCKGPHNVTQDCNTNPCPIDGIWLDWGEWGPCNVTCGGGARERVRDCEQPKYGGKDCEGEDRQFLGCAQEACLIPGDWFQWTEWTVCTVTCDGGKRQRTRGCDMTSYGNLTKPCEGNAQEDVDCHTFPCLPLARTCSEWQERGLTIDTEADIDPDGPGEATLEPVVVFCDLTAYDGIGVTVIGHDQENRHRVQGWEGAREYEVQLIYNITFDHVISIIDQSEYCEQYISWECFAALIHNYNDNNKVTTGWLNRTGGIADYFGGASPGSHSCACGMNHTCAMEAEVCNCDSNDQVWRQDDGYLTFKDDLPVYAFVAGDTGEWLKEHGYFTVGTVDCYGHDTSH